MKGILSMTIRLPVTPEASAGEITSARLYQNGQKYQLPDGRNHMQERKQKDGK